MKVPTPIIATDHFPLEIDIIQTIRLITPDKMKITIEYGNAATANRTMNGYRISDI